MEPSSKTKINYVLVNDESNDTEICIYDYTDKSIVMTCSEHFGKSFSEQLKGIGKYNGNLKVGKGWIFPKSKYGELQKLVSDIIEKKVKGVVPYEPKKVDIYEVTGPLGQLHKENPIVSDFKKLMIKLSEIKDVSVVKSNELTYIFGNKESVDNTMKEMDKNESNIIHSITSIMNKLVVVN
jgi:hypothetical protein